MARRSYTRRRRLPARDYFWAYPGQAVGDLSSQPEGPFNVDTVGWSDFPSSSEVFNYSNALIRILPRHGATSVRFDMEREFNFIDETWYVHYFAGEIVLAMAASAVDSGKTGYFAGRVVMATGVMIPRTEGSGVPSGLYEATAQNGVKEIQLATVNGDQTADTMGYGGVDRRTFRRLPIRRMVSPGDSFYINFERDHSENVKIQPGPQIGVFGRFRCSKA